MKYKLLLLFSLLLPASPVILMACGPEPPSRPEFYLMFRRYDPYSDDIQAFEYNPGAGENCRKWKDQTRTHASIKEIYEVVYKATGDELETVVYANPYTCSNVLNRNHFISTLRNDPEALAFLLLAKRCEYLRSKMCSPWYYPAKKDSCKMSLEEVATEAKNYAGSRFRSRYALQAVRALLTLRRYDDCINYWNSVKEGSGDDILTRMSLRYVAGAYYNIGEQETAKRLFAQAGDDESLMLCAQKEGSPSLEVIYQYYPESQCLRDYFAGMVSDTEKHMEYDDWDSDRRVRGTISGTERIRLEAARSFCLKVAGEGRVSDPAYWYYMAAFVDHLFGNNASASQLLARAEKSKGPQYVRESIRVFRIYLNAELTPWSETYATRMVVQLRWLDDKITAEKPPREIDDCFLHELNHFFSASYWNDMMRKTVLGCIVPKLLANGQGALAIAFANYADNKALSSMPQYRTTCDRNEHDWKNSLFALVDTVELHHLVRYVGMLEHPGTEAERFLKAGGYTNPDYFRDIIGTRYLREMRYQQAEKWLSEVSPAFQWQMNVVREGYLRRDPFSLTLKEAERSDAKYAFAREMASLERSIARMKDPDRRSLLKVRFATGIKSSATQCWALTFYGTSYMDSFYGLEERKERWPDCQLTQFGRVEERLLTCADRLFREALLEARDPEVKAQIQLTLGNMATVMKEFADTQAAASIRGRCDNYCDYHLDSYSRAGYDAWINY